jgi:RNA polymerase sigma-70 factor (ECF subfamily)
VSIKVMDYSSTMAKEAQRKQLLGDDPDLALLKAMVRHDVLALEELYRRRGPGILAYLAGRLRERGLAEEVLQDVMLSAWQGAPRFRGECRVYTWLLAIARNRAINAFHRQRSAHAPAVSFEEAQLEWLGEASPEIESFGAYDGIYAALLTLPEEQRETLELVFFHGLSLAETALVLRISAGTVKSRLHRAKARMREIMEREAQSNE